jgi:nucleoside-diphosphate-sugar epimerase
LRRAGHSVVGLARSPSKARLLAAEEIAPVLGTLEAPQVFLPAAMESDLIVHAAADAGSGMFALDRKFLEAVLSGRGGGSPAPKILYTSGTWIYGDTAGRRVDETAPLNPPAYGRQRVENERLVLEAGGLVLRPGCVYGRRGSLTSMWFASAAAGALEIVGDGSARWALVHQDDLAEAYVAAAESGRSGQIFNVSDDSEATVMEMARSVAQVTGYAGAIRSLPVPEAIQRFGPYAECLAYDQRLDSGKAERVLGWKPGHAGFLAEVETYFESWKASTA